MESKNPYLNGACSFPEKLRQKPSCRLMAKDLKLASVEAMVGKSKICCLLAMMVELIRLLALISVSSTRMKVWSPDAPIQVAARPEIRINFKILFHFKVLILYQGFYFISKFSFYIVFIQKAKYNIKGLTGVHKICW